MTSLLRKSFLSAALCGLVCVPAASRADSVISTMSDWNGSTNVHDFGVPNTATYGQTITAPGGGDLLTSFTFQMKGSTSLEFQAYVFAWNGTMATGAALYTSAVTTQSGSDGFLPITFNTGGLALTAGSEYVLFTSISEITDPGNSGLVSFGSLSGDYYADGRFVYLNNGANSSQWTSTAWSQTFIDANDLAFTATFTSPNPGTVPEPSAVISMAVGGAMALAAAYRRRRSA